MWKSVGRAAMYVAIAVFAVIVGVRTGSAFAGFAVLWLWVLVEHGD